MKKNKVFDELFVLELANNHWGSLERGLKIIEEYGKIVRFNNVKAAIKLQIRDVDNFVHKDYKDTKDSRYIQKTLRTKMTLEQHKIMADAIRATGCLVMATPFDETSVKWAVEIGCDALKVASSDINDWFLLHKIADTRLPVAVSTGGASLKSIDDMVCFFENRNISIAINHCVSHYPSEDSELELDQIEFLKERYPHLVIGHSTHEYHDWHSSMLISYAKGARTWERHIDIPYPKGHQQKEVSPYCSLPHQMDEYFKTFYKAKSMCGNSRDTRRSIEEKEVKYLDALVRGVYLKKDFSKGHKLTNNDVYLAVPLTKGQLSPKEFMEGEILTKDLKQHSPICIDDIEHWGDDLLIKTVYNRGIVSK